MQGHIAATPGIAQLATRRFIDGDRGVAKAIAAPSVAGRSKRSSEHPRRNLLIGDQAYHRADDPGAVGSVKESLGCARAMTYACNA
jgi:hypothetical protein